MAEKKGFTTANDIVDYYRHVRVEKLRELTVDETALLVTEIRNLNDDRKEVLKLLEIAIIYLEDGARNTATDILRGAYKKAKGEK
jgi:hypothetical protein